MGEYYDAQLREFEAKTAAYSTFPNFCTFIVTKFAKQSKGNRCTAKAVGFGIVNAATEAKRTTEEQAEETTWAIAELANALTTAQKKEFEQLTTMFGQMMQKLGAQPVQGNGGGGSNNPNGDNTAAQGIAPVPVVSAIVLDRRAGLTPWLTAQWICLLEHVSLGLGVFWVRTIKIFVLINCLTGAHLIMHSYCSVSYQCPGWMIYHKTYQVLFFCECNTS